MTHDQMLQKLIAIEEMVAELRLALARGEVEKPAPVEPAQEPRSELEEIIARVQGGEVTYEKVRNVVVSMGRTFSAKEIASLMGAPEHIVYRHICQMAGSGMLKRSMATKGRRVVAEAFTYVKTADLEPGSFEPAPTEKPRGEHLRVEGLGADRMATGEPVRVSAVEKLHRRGRSTPGVGHHAKQTDKRYAAQQAKRAERNGKKS